MRGGEHTVDRHTGKLRNNKNYGTGKALRDSPAWGSLKTPKKAHKSPARPGERGVKSSAHSKKKYTTIKSR